MVKRTYVDLAHGQVHCRVAKRQGKPWLILLHQSPSSSQMFEDVIPHLTNHFSILAPDNPGFGNSDPIDNVTIKALGTAVLNVLNYFSITKAFIFGHHTGASIAAYLGAHHSELCTAIAMCGPPALTPTQREMLPAMAPVEVPDANGEHLTRMWHKLRAKETSAPPSLSTRELGLAFSASATLKTYQAVADYDFMADLAAIKCPLFLFAGERDSLAGYLKAASAAAPNAKLKLIEDAGGYICDMRPDYLASLLSDFFLEVAR
jgi:pimeloyl-ACP methyl ester carboxylesterase